MNIILDSTEYKKDRNLSSKNFSLLRDLGKRKLLKNHITWFVYQECITSSIYESLQKVQDAISAINTLPRLGLSKSELNNSEKIVTQLSSLEQKIRSSVIAQWNDFVYASNSTLHKFERDHSTIVFQDYFNGSRPFSTIKSRKDIPDAYILQEIKELSKRDNVFVVSNDSNFRESVEFLIPNVVTCSSLTDFFKNKKIEEILEKYNNLIDNEQKLNFINRYLRKFQPEIEEEVLEYIDSISYLEFFDDKLRSDDKSAIIQYLSSPIFHIIYGDIKIIGKEAFIPISIECDADIEYTIFKGEYWTYDDLPKYSDEINKHYFLIEDTVKLKLEQNIVIDLDDVQINENEELGFVPFPLGKFDLIEII